MSSELSDTQVLGLHLLPADALGQIIKRLWVEDIERLAAISCRSISSAARADSVWILMICSHFGSTLASSVSASINVGSLSSGQHEEGEANSQLDLSGRLTPCSQHVVTFFEGQHRPDSFRAAYWILEHVVTCNFVSDPDSWVAKLTSAEPTEEARARVLATLAHRIARALAACRECNHEQTQLYERCCLAMSTFMTMKNASSGASLARAVCRAFLSSFDFAGMELVPALRLFLRSVKMPREQARLCRMLWAFAGAFYDQNSCSGRSGLVYDQEVPGDYRQNSLNQHGKWLSHDAVYLLVMSLVVLHTDAHNPVVKTKLQV